MVSMSSIITNSSVANQAAPFVQPQSVQPQPANSGKNDASGNAQGPMRKASGLEFEAAVQERQQLSYDEPADTQRKAIGQYQQVALFERRDQIQQMVGVDTFA